MFSFWRKFSESPQPARFERSLLRLFVRPRLDAATRANIKKRVLNHIAAECEELRSAELLDLKLSGQKVHSSGLLDLLAAIAEALLNLPKVLPRHNLREVTREHFQPRNFFRLFAVLRQATAFFVLLVFAGGITLTTFISQTQTAVAQLSVSSGIVKIRVADSPFFEDVREFATVRLGDTIRVGENSTAELAFYDASKMFLTESTEVEITDFKPDLLTRENSSVKVALLSGAVDAEVAKSDSSFAVETSTGLVEATSAKFSVAVNPTTGSTKIETSEDSVAVKSANDSEAVALTAGESVTFADTVPTVAVAEIPELPALSKIQTDLELVKVWSFDALIAAENGDQAVAQQTLETNRAKLSDLLAAGGAESVEGDELAAFTDFLQQNYPDGPGRASALADLQQAARVDQILNYYFTAPQKLRGVPEFQILARDGYAPSGRLRNLFAILRAGELAHAEVQPLVDRLSAELTAELFGKLDNTASLKSANQLLSEMQNQPIFIPILERLQDSVAPKFAEAIGQKIAAMEARVSEYIGG
ncbi:MAG: FecR domain-containing protein [Patescibacteria group bacterium]